MLLSVYSILASLTPSERSEDVGTEASDTLFSPEVQRAISIAGDLSRSSSESQLHDMSMELANRGPKQSELELRCVSFTWQGVCVVLPVALSK